MKMSDLWTYDLETFPTCFTFGIGRVSDNPTVTVYEVSSRRNDIDKIIKCLDYLAAGNFFMVGYNNLGFDYPILHEMLLKRNKLPKDGAALAKMMYNLAQKQIDSFKGVNKFGNTVKADERYVPQLDLYKIHHFDNKAKATSLKMLEFVMKRDNIEDLPFPVGMELNHDEMQVLCDYNKEDILATIDFCKKSMKAIEMREQLTEKYNRDFMNHNDTKIGKDFFQMQLVENDIKLHKMENGKRKMKQSIRKQVAIKDCLFKYYKFSRPEFQAVHDWFANQVVTETKGVFSDIEEHNLGDVAKYAELLVKKKKFTCDSIDGPTDKQIADFMRLHPLGYIDKVELKAKKKGVSQYSYWGCWRIATTLNVVVDGFRYDFGVGGIHGSVSTTIVSEDEESALRDADVSSMYPNISISNRAFPEHLGEVFCDIYHGLYIERTKHAKGTADNAVLKLALNGTYGASGDKFSVFYDIKFMLTITCNGQLSLAMLADWLLTIPGLRVVQANTDGITCLIPRDKLDRYEMITKKWQERVKLELEFADYEKMYIRDVNNYVAKYTNGKFKHKGAYVYEDLEWHKNHSFKIVQMAACAAMLEGKDVREFIESHKNKYDFFGCTKVPRSSSLVIRRDNGEEKLQNICRYYVSKPSAKSGKLFKLMPALETSETGDDRELSIESGWLVTPCNDINNFEWDVDYDYYVSEAEKLIIK